ncbi:hypothetical protein BDV95DRAFT_279395 [Massariosphaeria phaeospora]|uniref:Uncharacterized protein n=1 Tax=Massariosphaeria phaeospora TaxID=100035 RepID=A0A7C8MAQ4_9PLEO|nr:hypothetical protein BDV95DRAFT_279395 [Massariosphaeria phaeospora]
MGWTWPRHSRPSPPTPRTRYTIDHHQHLWTRHTSGHTSGHDTSGHDTPLDTNPMDTNISVHHPYGHTNSRLYPYGHQFSTLPLRTPTLDTTGTNSRHYPNTLPLRTHQHTNTRHHPYEHINSRHYSIDTPDQHATATNTSPLDTTPTRHHTTATDTSSRHSPSTSSHHDYAHISCRHHPYGHANTPKCYPTASSTLGASADTPPQRAHQHLGHHTLDTNTSVDTPMHWQLLRHTMMRLQHCSTPGRHQLGSHHTLTNPSPSGIQLRQILHPEATSPITSC